MISEGAAAKAMAVAVSAFLAGLGGIASYLHELHSDDGKRFSAPRLISRMFIACVVGVAADDLLPMDIYGRGAFIVASGFLSLTIVGLVREKGPEQLRKWLP